MLSEGPWVKKGHYLVVQRWSPNQNPYSYSVRKLAIWVRVPNLPFHFYDEENLVKIGNIIGKRLKVDKNSLPQQQGEDMMVDRGRYARICVEVDLSRKLRSRVVLRRRAFRVEYEGLGLICFKCGRYGHKTDVCPINVTQTANPAPPPQDKPP